MLTTGKAISGDNGDEDGDNDCTVTMKHELNLH